MLAKKLLSDIHEFFLNSEEYYCITFYIYVIVFTFIVVIDFQNILFSNFKLFLFYSRNSYFLLISSFLCLVILFISFLTQCLGIFYLPSQPSLQSSFILFYFISFHFIFSFSFFFVFVSCLLFHFLWHFNFISSYYYIHLY